MATYQSQAGIAHFFTYASVNTAAPVLAISLSEQVSTAFKGAAKTGVTATFTIQKNDPTFAKFLDTYKVAVSGSTPESWVLENGVSGGGATTAPPLVMVWFGGIADSKRQCIVCPVSITENTGDFTTEFNKSAKRSFEVKSVAPPSALQLGTTADTAAIMFSKDGAGTTYGALFAGSTATTLGAALFTDTPANGVMSMPASRTIPTTRHGFELWLPQGTDAA